MNRSGKNKTVLMISASYPPRISPASRRPACLAKYLVGAGWRPVVFCQPRGRDLFRYDPEFVTDIPDEVEVVQSSAVEAPRSTWCYAPHLIRKFLTPHLKEPLFIRSAREILPGIFNKHDVDVIWATSPPLSSHLLAARASERWGVPWIADFRDIANQNNLNWRSTLATPAAMFFERLIARSASEIITVSEGLGEIMQNRHGRTVRVISNGFDPVDLEIPPVEGGGNTFKIVFAGRAITRHPGFLPLLDALETLSAVGKVDLKDFSIEFYGYFNGKWLGRRVKRHRCFDLIKFSDPVPWRESRKIMRSASILLQNAFPGTRGVITSKIFEYLASRRPILAIPGDNDCVDALLGETNAGVSCSTADEVASQLLTWYREWKATGTIRHHGNMEAVMKYSRKKQAAELAAVLDAYARREKTEAPKAR